MKKVYESWEPQIKAFFEENNLNYSKVKKCGKAMGVIGGKRTLLLQDISQSLNSNLLDDTPAPIVLKAIENDGRLIFEKTEYTDKYFN